ncbi:TPA: hypothetical protein JAJ28_000571 [Aeromonas hydrophila]|uniref:Uncharacterized protein n=1 Tax=Aeromonas hydrophila TaxID=644 RepID=A0AAD3YJ06_AERHY|nr:hypothetical protein [Aeromonas hydrophila]HAT6342892.1 hypothetical protein [Aeromonas hydrophila]
MSAILNLPFCVYFFKKQTSPALTEIATLLLVLCAVGRVCVDWWLIGCGWLRDTAQATAKSVAGVGPPQAIKAHNTRQACFFVQPSSTRNFSYGGLGGAASRLAGFL